MKFLESILASEKLAELQRSFQNQESVLIEELWNAPKALIATLAQRATGKHILILTGASHEEVRLFNDFALFSDCPLTDFPAWETLPSEQIPPSPDIVGERYKLLEAVTKSQTPHIILTGLQACLQRLIAPKAFKDLFLDLKVGNKVGLKDIVEHFLLMGYRQQNVATDKGVFAVRADIIDIFPVSSPDPFRIEFWGDEVESIRIYDPIGQKSVREVHEAHISPALELEFLKEYQLGSIIDYLGPNTLVIFDDLLALEDRYAALAGMPGSQGAFSTIEEFLQQVMPLQKIFWSASPIEELSEVKVLDKKSRGFYSDNAPMQQIAFEMFNRDISCKRWRHPFQPVTNFLMPEIPNGEGVSGEELLASLGRLAQSDFELHFLSISEAEENKLHDRIAHAKVTLPKKTNYHQGYLSSGFVLPNEQMMVFPMTEVTHRYKIRRQKIRSTYHTAPSEVLELAPGEAIVHLNNGIGRYVGLEKKVNHLGIESEFFLIEYADQAKLFVPINQANLLSKYIGVSEEVPKLHTLGSNRWKKVREQTEKAIKGYATELMQLYAIRSIKEGFQYQEDGAEMLAFEEEFPYVETEDQVRAIADIKKDMISKKSMDRLICGDVGYGKTEVAMRAAFKAVLDGRKQVAVLVPTTVLAMQHYENFKERMANFPVNVAVLSRFCSQKEVREAIKGVAEGTIDILVGTHRIIGEDVVFKDLGLVIIDEEQRFGVKVKEHLKRLKVEVDCLTLSATPIPRTLYMSLLGARDMSVINTPPQDRLPIKTILTESNDQVITNALLRELNRDGQAYIIHNRVETIYDMRDRIQKLLPQARILVGHGQMHSDELDHVFHTFKSGNADILISTTIIENGIDIPNANTIIVFRADLFGMADLYQLRGRVGRWNRPAYAYLIIPKGYALSEISHKRLQALAEASGYGGGMKVALDDLRLRGAGNIIGEEQSGFVSALGFELYCKLLKKTILSLQGKLPEMTEVKLDLPIDARIPDDYVDVVHLRMEIYQRFGEAISWEEIDAIKAEIVDRYGPLPEPALWLYHLTRLRIYASLQQFNLIKFDKMSLTTEQQKGKTDLVHRKVLFTMPKTPQELETKILQIIKA
jgi:transcription-repair coupling factor (superfamily II helicase)